MGLSGESIYFITLGTVAIALLWGVSLWNGTVTELIFVTWHGRFEDGTFFKTNYTGIIFIDFPLSLLVAFFFYGTNGSDPGYQLFLIDAYSTLQSAFVWLYVESNRKGKKPATVDNPIIWAFLWQGFGAAISLPFYYYNHLKWLNSRPQLPSVATESSSRALLISFLLGAVFPMIVGMLPTWADRSSALHQNVLAAWQLDPVWVAAIQAGCASIFAGPVALSSKKNGSAVYYTRVSYLLATLLSASGHLYALGKMVSSSDPRLGLVRTYVPYLFSGPEGVSEKLANGPWLFLQCDLIIIAISSLSWAYILVSQLMDQASSIRKTLPLLFVLGWLILGPGGTVSLVLFWREGELRRRRGNVEGGHRQDVIEKRIRADHGSQ